MNAFRIELDSIHVHTIYDFKYALKYVEFFFLSVEHITRTDVVFIGS